MTDTNPWQRWTALTTTSQIRAIFAAASMAVEVWEALTPAGGYSYYHDPMTPATGIIGRRDLRTAVKKLETRHQHFGSLNPTDVSASLSYDLQALELGEVAEDCSRAQIWAMRCVASMQIAAITPQLDARSDKHDPQRDILWIPVNQAITAWCLFHDGVDETAIPEASVLRASAEWWRRYEAQSSETLIT